MENYWISIIYWYATIITSKIFTPLISCILKVKLFFAYIHSHIILGLKPIWFIIINASKLLNWWIWGSFFIKCWWSIFKYNYIHKHHTYYPKTNSSIRQGRKNLSKSPWGTGIFWIPDIFKIIWSNIFRSYHISHNQSKTLFI